MPNFRLTSVSKKRPLLKLPCSLPSIAVLVGGANKPRRTRAVKPRHTTQALLWRQIGDNIDSQVSWPWKHFFASKIVLRVIVCCLRGVGSMSSSRRIPRFIVVFSSGHRWLFFVASLWAYVVVASFLCLRVVGSSFRRLRHILGQVLDVWGHILY